ncbi:hypothetical protein BMS3Abin04_03076 [bacterium BMS3Abin04]|nr:hypothetical protein BMS3Abin04_03076 [bacterium BMS3Abin04]
MVLSRTARSIYDVPPVSTAAVSTPKTLSVSLPLNSKSQTSEPSPLSGISLTETTPNPNRFFLSENINSVFPSPSTSANLDLNGLISSFTLVAGKIVHSALG